MEKRAGNLTSRELARRSNAFPPGGHVAAGLLLCVEVG
jgi:hypothetical protein